MLCPVCASVSAEQQPWVGGLGLCPFSASVPLDTLWQCICDQWVQLFFTHTRANRQAAESIANVPATLATLCFAHFWALPFPLHCFHPRHSSHHGVHASFSPLIQICEVQPTPPELPGNRVTSTTLRELLLHRTASLTAKPAI